MFSSIVASRRWDGSRARRCKLICLLSNSYTKNKNTYGLSVGIVHVSIALLDKLLGVLQDLVEMVGAVNDLVVRDLNHGQVLLDTLLKELLSHQPSLSLELC